MDLATLIGILGAFGIVAAAMVLGGSAGLFINIPSLLIVLLGSIFVVLMKFNIGQTFSSLATAGKAFMFKLEKPEEIIEKAVELAEAARKGGLLSLEGLEIPNPFMKSGVMLLVDGHDAEVVKTMLYKDIGQVSARHKIAQAFFRAMADVGPAMGMIGTLIGLVQMLANMDDPKSIGPAMAVALLTTLYGAMLATMVANPIADKLELRTTEEKLIKSMIVDALMGIQAGQNPRVIESTLKNYLPSGKRGSDDDGDG